MKSASPVPMKPAPTADEIKAVEKRMEARRQEMARRYDDVREGVKVVAAKGARSWPYLLVGGSLAAGYAMSRAPRKPPPLHYATQFASEFAPRFAPAASAGMQAARPVAYAVPADHPSHWMRKVAAILGVAATAVRIATSGEVRALLGAYRAFRARRR